MPADTNKVLALYKLAGYYENSIPDSATYYYEQARQLGVQLSYPAGFIKYATNYTAVLNMQGKFQQSLALLQQAEDTCRRYKLDKQLISVLGSYGVLYQYTEDYNKAIEYYLRILLSLEKEDERHLLGAVYSNLVGLYSSLHQYQKACNYGRLALAYEEKRHDLYAIAAACINLGLALKQLDSIPQARNFHRRAYRLALQQKDVSLQTVALINLGDDYDKPTEPDSYLPLYQKALMLARSMGDVIGQSVSLKGVCEGLFWNKRYREAEAILDTAIHFALSNNQKDMGRGMLLLMSDIQIASGKMQQSVRYRKQYEALQDSAMNTDRAKNIQELETKYELEKKQHEILQKNLELTQKEQVSQRQRWYLLLSCAGVLILGLFLFLGYRYFRQRMADQENLRLKAKLEGQEQERQRISQEMHDDMGSGLTSVLFLSRMVKEPGQVGEKIQRTTNGLVRKMNEIIWTMNPGQDSLDSLLAYMRVNIAEVLEHAGLRYHFDLPDEIPAIPVSQEYRRNIYLATKEAAHNIVKHANATEVNIDVRVNGTLDIAIRDNGKGFDPLAISRFGNGLTNQRQRMERIGGIFEISSGQGTVIRLSAPL